MSPEKIESIALASVISLAFAILLSMTTLIFNKLPLVMLLWGMVAGMVLGHREVKRIYVILKLAIIPSAVLCLAPTVMALLRALLAETAGVIPDVQNFMGYSIFNPGWWHSKPGAVSVVLLVSFIVSTGILTICSLSSGRIQSHLSTAYSPGPAAFERVEKILKRVLAIGSVIGVYLFVQ